MKIKLFVLGLSLSIGSLLSATGSLASICLSEADRLYLENERAAAEQQYRQCKEPFPQQNILSYFPEPITDPDQLSPGAAVYWREAQAGLANDSENQTFISLNLLLTEYPAFVPAYGTMADALERYDRDDEVLELLEQAATRFPHNASIARARANALRNDGQALEASMASRLFAIVNPNHPERDDFIEVADDDLKAFKKGLRTQFAISGGIGVLGTIFGGGGDQVSNAVDAVQLATMLASGEKKTGNRLAANVVDEAQANNVYIDDPVVLDYINQIGQDIAAQMGRDEFDYEFHIIADPSLNAFALPGGKVFINTGAILAANSEAELAGLLAHELAHTVLSHGYKQLANNALLNAANNTLPLGDLAGLASLGISREHERQSDILATRAVAGFGYAADGLRNLFVTLNEQSGSGPAEYLSTHPAPPTRISYLEALIQQNGYNRYAYEGVESHARIQQRIRQLTGQ